MSSTVMSEAPMAQPMSFRRIVGAAWAPSTWLGAVHLALNLPLGILWFTLLATGLSSGVGMLVTLVGIPILMLTAMVGRGAGIVERARLRVFLGHALPDPYRRAAPGIWSFWRTRLTDPALWRDLLYLLLRLPIGIMTFTVVVTLWAVPLACLASPFILACGEPVETIGDHRIDTLWGALLLALAGLPLVVVAAWGTRAMAGLERLFASAMLGTSPAQLSARLDALADSRSRSVDAAEAERRRIERDLHDGAQQRLVALAMTLGMAREKMGTDPAAATALVAEAHDESKRVLQELRDLLRGIHPTVLVDRGLDAAISGLAARCPVPVSVSVDVAPRPAAAVESAAYFVVAEAITNATRHAGATRIDVAARREGDRLVVEVTDDGRGGARIVEGGGLAGLSDRMAALEGRLEVSSPEGGPTTVRAEMPCVS